jgi:hypothetical protein
MDVYNVFLHKADYDDIDNCWSLSLVAWTTKFLMNN